MTPQPSATAAFIPGPDSVGEPVLLPCLPGGTGGGMNSLCLFISRATLGRGKFLMICTILPFWPRLSWASPLPRNSDATLCLGDHPATGGPPSLLQGKQRWHPKASWNEHPRQHRIWGKLTGCDSKLQTTLETLGCSFGRGRYLGPWSSHLRKTVPGKIKRKFILPGQPLCMSYGHFAHMSILTIIL